MCFDGGAVFGTALPYCKSLNFSCQFIQFVPLYISASDDANDDKLNVDKSLNDVNLGTHFDEIVS
jgi:hypothetical protein